jgi:hypothetical protein
MIAAAARKVVSKIRLHFPVKGCYWDRNALTRSHITAVRHSLKDFDRLINPDRRSFSDYCRRNLDQIAGFQVVHRAILGAALGVVINRYNGILKHYKVEAVICEDSSPGLFTRYNVSPIRGRRLEDLELAADTLDSSIRECSDFLDWLDQVS